MYYSNNYLSINYHCVSNTKFRNTVILFLIVFILTVFSIRITRHFDLCRKMPRTVEYSANGLAIHVKEYFKGIKLDENIEKHHPEITKKDIEGHYPEITSQVKVKQYGCTIVLEGFVDNEFIEDYNSNYLETNDLGFIKDLEKEIGRKVKTEDFLSAKLEDVEVEGISGGFFHPIKKENVDTSKLRVTQKSKGEKELDRLFTIEEEFNQNKVKIEVIVDTIWVIFCGVLVFFMNAGFAMLEAGFCRDRNSINVLAKNLVVFGITAIAFWIIGFGIMFGNSSQWNFNDWDVNKFIGFSGFLLNSSSENSPTIGSDYKGVFTALKDYGIPLNAKFFFQLTFASTSATIVSGAVAERIRFKSFFLFIPLFIIFSYSIIGHWVWGGGWLSENFWDFAGSSVVHSVGGYAALVGTLWLGPRLDKYSEKPLPEESMIIFALSLLIKRRLYQFGLMLIPVYNELSRIKYNQKTFRCILDFKNGFFHGLCGFFRGPYGPYKIMPVPSDALSLSTLGCLILWLGWIGFNTGSLLDANYIAISHILLNTIIAGSTGGIGSLIGAWIYLDKPSIAFLINGILAGCVSITASCAYVSLPFAAIIGFSGGFFVIFATVLLEKLKIDDPVGAVPVHLACGIWGTLAVGLFSEGIEMYPRYGIDKGPEQGWFLGGDFSLSVMPQINGIIVILIYSISISLLLWWIVSKIGFKEKIPGTNQVKKVHGLRISEEEECEGTNIEFDDFFHN